MSSENVDIRIRLRDQGQTSAGIKKVSGDLGGLGLAAKGASTATRGLGAASDFTAAGIDRLWHKTRMLRLGLVGLGAAGLKWGLGYNAEVETAQNRFELFTKTVGEAKQVLQGVDQITIDSAFSLGELSDAAANLGNQGMQVGRIVPTLQGIANAAAASGKGAEALATITEVIGQIQASGKINAIDVNRLIIAGAPGVQKTLQRELGLTADQVRNIGRETVDGHEALQALTKEWTSGKIADAAKRQTQTLSGQWRYLKGSVRHGLGELTDGLAQGLSKKVLPAAIRATSQIRAIFRDDTLAPRDKLERARRIIDKELGPIWDDLLHELDKADIPRHLGTVVGDAIPFMAEQAAKGAPKAAEAFVKAWLNSGPWAMLIGALYLGGKGRKALKRLGIGGKAGGVLGGLAGAGLGKTKPIPVWVVNQGGGDTLGDWVKKYGPKVGAGAAAAKVARVGGPAAMAAAAGYEAYREVKAPAPGRFDPITSPNEKVGFITGIRRLFGELGGGGTSLTGRETDPLRQSLLGGMPPIELKSTTILKVDGREMARNTTRQKAKVRARRAGG